MVLNVNDTRNIISVRKPSFIRIGPISYNIRTIHKFQTAASQVSLFFPPIMLKFRAPIICWAKSSDYLIQI
jgi:hypothetical protein